MHVTKALQMPTLLATAVCVFAVPVAGDVQLHPLRSATLADGGVFGPFDGVADHADWFPAALSYRGSIALAPLHGMEHRMVFKYDLSDLTPAYPIQAALHLIIQGGTRHDRPDSHVEIYSYSADPYLTLLDFASGPAVLRGSIAVPMYQPPTEYSVDVGVAIREALAAGEKTIAFRLQIGADVEETGSQAFLHAPDSTNPLMPYLSVQADIPGDCDGDGDVDVDDFDGFLGCILGPGGGVEAGCDCFDLDDSGSVDLRDFAAFQIAVTAG